MCTRYHGLDKTQLDQVRQLDAFRPGAAAQLVSLFEINTRQRLDALRTACASGDVDSMRNAAHSLKGISVSVGASGLAELAAAIESDACGPIDLVPLEAAFKATMCGLAAWLAEV